MRPITAICALTVLLLALRAPAQSGEPARSPGEWLAWFSQQWDENAWRGGRGRRGGYMRPMDDRGWRARMLAFRGMVAAGKEAIGPLTNGLQHNNAPTRILAAQSLGYLAPHVLTRSLADAAKNDTAPAARLYAVDALGMQGRGDNAGLLAELKKTQRHGDVRKHVNYALERKTNGLDEKIVKSLLAWDPGTMSSAKVGQLAPDFELPTVSGKNIRLSGFRGRKNVVLVFIYGDT